MKFSDEKLGQIGENDLGYFYKGITHNFFELKETYLSEEEQKFAAFLERLIQMKSSFTDFINFEYLPDDFDQKFREEIISQVEMYRLLEKMPSKEIFFGLLESLIKLISPVDKISNKALFAESVLQNSIGLKELSFFSLEKDFEELMINALDEVFIFHKEFGMCKVEIKLNEKVFDNILQRIAHSVGKEFNNLNPLLDARLPDGSRVNATMNLVSPRSKSLTIRKFSVIPLSIIDLIKNKTITAQAAAFLWLMVDGYGISPRNILIVGGTSSGKTTFLTILSNFIRLNQRIVSIEDTLELSLFNRENWVALESKQTMQEDVSMGDLLKNSLRMRPDRLIVGEVRGKEAITLFTAMDNGHAGCLGTIHSNTAKDALIKLENRPFEIPSVMLPLVDLIVVMQRQINGDKITRKVTQITELSHMDNKVLSANVFELNEFKELIKTDLPSHAIEKLANENSLTKNEIKKEIENRQLILKWIMENKLSKPQEVLEVIQSYYFNPEKVINLIYDKN